MPTHTPRKWLKVLLPPFVLLGAIGAAAIMVALKPEPEKKPPVPVHPRVDVYTVGSAAEALQIASQGSVRPRRQTRLTARVSGPVEWVSPQFYAGGTFAEGDLLLRLDPLPYESALAEARSRLAQAEALWLQEREAAEQARKDWESVGAGPPSPLVLRQPQIARTEADLEAARVAVAMAQQNRAHVEIRAPYDGRVDEKFVDVGQSVSAQATPLGDIHATDSLEVSLPLSLDEAAYVAWPPAGPAEGGPPVRLLAEIAGQEHQWEAYLDRTSASVDPQTRMLTAIARVDAPALSQVGMPLKPGMFVRARIEGRLLAEAVRLPRSAVQPGNRVYRLGEDNRLHALHVELLYNHPDYALVQGLQAGDLICLTPLLFFVEGMQVEPVPAGPGLTNDHAGMHP